MTIASAIAIVLAMACIQAETQNPGLPDISSTEAAKIPPFPPRSVKTTIAKNGVVISWEPSPLQNVTGYRIYRRTAKDDKFVIIGEVLAPPFTHRGAQRGEEYAVAAVNSYGAESVMSSPQKLPEKPK